MFVDFDRCFHPTIEEQIEDAETALRIHKEAIIKKWCSTCKHWKAPPNNLPGFVENHGDCNLKHSVDATECSDYELDEVDETLEYQRIKRELDELTKKATISERK